MIGGVSKPWNPARNTVAVRPSRIRRQPVALSESPVESAKAQARSDEREIWGGVAGVLLMAAAVVVLTVGVSLATIFHDDPGAAARAARFEQCYNAEGRNCVLEGDTIYVGGEKVEIAGIAAPHIQGAQCEAERSRGIAAAVRLAELLNGGKVTVGRAFRDDYGRAVRKVQVDGEDVGETMISAGLARDYVGDSPEWC
jgi:micrococcal nuclease